MLFKFELQGFGINQPHIVVMVQQRTPVCDLAILQVVATALPLRAPIACMTFVLSLRRKGCGFCEVKYEY